MRTAAAGMLAGVALLASACGSGGDTDEQETAGATPAARVDVGETEYALALSQATLEPGTYTFVVTNDGTVEHALEIEGPGVDEAQTETLAPGESAELTVTLGQGAYELYCPVDGHADLGMKLALGVGGAAAEPEPSPAEPPPSGGYGGYGSGD